MHKLSENTTLLLLLFLSTACLISALPIVKQNPVPPAVHVDSETTSLPMVLDLNQDEIGSQNPEEALFEEQLTEQNDQLSPYEVTNYQPYVANRRQKRQSWAHDYANRLAQKKPVYYTGNVDPKNLQNWNVGLGAPVWQSESGRHNVGVGGTYAQSAESLQGDLLKTQNWNAGVGYGWESKNGKHGVGAAASYGHSSGNYLGESFKSPPQFNAGVGYRFRFGG